MILDTVDCRVVLAHRVLALALVSGQLVAVHVELGGLSHLEGSKWDFALEFEELILLVLTDLGNQLRLHNWHSSCFFAVYLVRKNT